MDRLVAIIPKIDSVGFQYEPKLTGMVQPGLFFSHPCCSFTKTNGGITMIGVAFITLLNAVSPTASIAAFLLFPRLSGSLVSPFCFCVKTSIPVLISPARIRPTLTTPADTTAANGTNRPKMSFVDGDTFFRRGTREFKPTATPQEAVTAVKYEVMRSDVLRGVDLLALEVLIATFTDWLTICQRTVPVV